MGKRRRRAARSEGGSGAAGGPAPFRLPGLEEDPAPAPAPPPPRRDLAEVLLRALRRDPAARLELERAWAGGEPVGPLLDEALRRELQATIDRGWTAEELARIVGKRRTADHRRLLEAAGEALARGGGPDAAGASHAVVDAWRSSRRATAPPAATVLDVVSLLPLLGFPPDGMPSGAGTAAAGNSGAGGAVLAKVRALLAKAESTPFGPEADALTAKAHELMARHAIDVALLDTRGGAGAGAGAGPVRCRRIGIDDPYADAKVQLLTQVATACRCRAVWLPGLGLALVYGYDGDLDAAELLHTSLLVQATAAVLDAGSERAGARTRSRGFRGSFLVSFAIRIGQRLAEATAHAVDEARAEHGDALLPVLASREEAVDEAVHRANPELRTRATRVSDAAGWTAGVLAADRADLGRQRLPGQPAGRLSP